MEDNYQKFQETYKNEMKKVILPEAIREEYEIKSCLKDGEESRTFLAKSRILGKFCVIKWAVGRFKKFLEQEYVVLMELNGKNLPGVPRPYCLLEEHGGFFF